jgi:hypothetical protein
MSPSLARIESQLEKLWNPRERMDPLTWAEREVMIDARFSPKPGRFDSSFTPYIRQLHRWFGDPNIRQITLQKSAQIGGTTFLANLMQWVPAEEPGPVLYVTSTADNAKSWSERELIPRIRSCPALRDLLPDDPDQFKKTEIFFKSCVMKLVGAQSVSALASRGVRYLFCDEVDKWPSQTDAEAPALELAMARTNFYERISKTVLASTPTVIEGAIHQQFLLGSQHRYHVVCQDCGKSQWLKFDQIKWSEDLRDDDGKWALDAVEESACYQCEECGSPWSQDRKRDLLIPEDLGGRAHWVQGNSSAPSDHISVHLSALYSPQQSWGHTAKLFLQKKDDPGGLHDFQNNTLGVPYETRVFSLKEERLLDLRTSEYRLREIPAAACVNPESGPVLLSICADPGQKETHWSVEARNLAGESWVIDYGSVLAIDDLNSAAFLSGLRYRVQGTEIYHCPTVGLVDSGDFTTTVYDMCAASGGRYFPSKGSAASFGTFSKSRIHGYPNLLLFTYVDFTWKFSLYDERIGRRLPPLLHWPADVGRDFIQGHAGQKILENRKNRNTPRFFAKVANDHWGDCSKLHQVCWAEIRSS